MSSTKKAFPNHREPESIKRDQAELRTDLHYALKGIRTPRLNTSLICDSVCSWLSGTAASTIFVVLLDYKLCANALIKMKKII